MTDWLNLNASHWEKCFGVPLIAFTAMSYVCASCLSLGARSALRTEGCLPSPCHCWGQTCREAEGQSIEIQEREQHMVIWGREGSWAYLAQWLQAGMQLVALAGHTITAAWLCPGWGYWWCSVMSWSALAGWVLHFLGKWFNISLFPTRSSSTLCLFQCPPCSIRSPWMRMGWGAAHKHLALI